MNKPMKKTRMLLAGTALALASVGGSAYALAVTIDLGTMTAGQTQSTGPIVHTPGNFSDTVTFALTTSGTGQVGYDNLFFKLNKIVFQQIGSLSLNLMGPSSFGTVSIANFKSGSDYDLSFVPGAYTATLNGTATGRSGGTYSFGVAAPVPEPAAWLTMVLGLAGAGWFARRKNASGKVGFKPSFSAV